MKMTETDLLGVLVLEPRVFEDERGLFFESYHEQRYREAGVPSRFVQDNFSCSTRGVLRGMHYQLGRPQAKLIQVTFGVVFDAVVDIRRGSPTFGKWLGMELSAENRRQLYVPEGFAHGFYVLSEVAHFSYKCSDFYAQSEERGLRWDDTDVGIRWPSTNPTLAPRDRDFPLLKDMSEDLPPYSPVPSQSRG